MMHLEKHSGSFTPPLPMEDSQTPPGSPPTKKRAPYVPTTRKRKSESGLDLEVSYHPETNQGSSRTIGVCSFLVACTLFSKVTCRLKGLSCMFFSALGFPSCKEVVCSVGITLIYHSVIR